MNYLASSVRRSLLAGAAALLILAMAGCDRHAVSQTPPAPRDPPMADAAPAATSPIGQPATAAESQPAAQNTPAPEDSQPPATSAAAPPGSDAPPRPSALRPKADRGTTPEGVEKITFDDLILGMDKDMVFRPWMLESESNGGRAKELEGKRVRLTGVMHGGVESAKKNKEFVLLRNKECKFGPGGQADHLAKIFMKDGKTVSYTDATVYVEGTLRIKPNIGDDGNTWSIYEIEGAEVK